MTTLSISKMTCESCVKLITMAIKSTGATPISVKIGSATFQGGDVNKVKDEIKKMGYSLSTK